jgi:hypothetical protein
VGIRETLNQKPAVTTAATAIIIVVMLGVIIYQSLDRGGVPTPATRAWYTLDDGKTWFADDSNRPTPFDYKGTPAYRVIVFTCDGGATTFAGYLVRVTDQQGDQVQVPSSSVVEIKPPLTGQAGWIRRDDPRSVTLLEPRCQGSGELASVVTP